jgi:hypothetical protein
VEKSTDIELLSAVLSVLVPYAKRSEKYASVFLFSFFEDGALNCPTTELSVPSSRLLTAAKKLAVLQHTRRSKVIGGYVQPA